MAKSKKKSFGEIQQIELVKLKDIKLNPENPRVHTEAQFRKLVRSIEEFPEMLTTRPIILDETGMILGGNFRVKAVKAAGYIDVPAIRKKDWSEEKKMEFIYKDNINSGEWDYKAFPDIIWDNFIAWGGQPVFMKREQVAEIKQTKEELPNMPIQFNEHHDYIVFLFENQNDWLAMLTKMNIGKMLDSLSPKRKKLGLGRVVDGRKLLEIMKNHEAKNSSSK